MFPVAFRNSLSFLRRILAHLREVKLACRHILWPLDFIWKGSQSTFQHCPANKYLRTDTPLVPQARRRRSSYSVKAAGLLAAPGVRQS